MANLKSNIITIKPRETSGASSSSRFDYQKDWSLCQLLEHHQKSDDYVFIFDYHEDLILMDSESNPSKISFYQIKGKRSGNWTLASLTQSGKDKDGNPLLSIIGKLYDCKCKFELQTESLNFVSNAPFSFKLEDGTNTVSKQDICIVQLTKKDREKIKNKLIQELVLSEDPVFEDVSFLKVTELSLEDSSAHSKGKLAEFLDTVKPNGSFAIPASYQSLFGEVKRRTGYNKDIKSFQELVERKGIGKSTLDRWLDEVAVHKDSSVLWKTIESALISDKFPVSNLKRLRLAWTDYELDLRQPNNDLGKKVRSLVKDIYQHLDYNGHLNSLLTSECMEVVFHEFKSKGWDTDLYSDDYIRVTILAEIYG